MPLESRRDADCDCRPLDEGKAMTSADVLRIFAPLPQDEADALRLFVGKD